MLRSCTEYPGILFHDFGQLDLYQVIRWTLYHDALHSVCNTITSEDYKSSKFLVSIHRLFKGIFPAYAQNYLDVDSNVSRASVHISALNENDNYYSIKVMVLNYILNL